MKKFGRCLCFVLVLLLVLPVFTSGAAVITPWENINDEFPAMYMDWYVKDGERVWDRIIWNERDFAHMFENIPSYEYTDSLGYWSGTRGRYSVSIDKSYDVNASDAVYAGNTLTFDYTATIDLAPDGEDKTTYHGLLVLFYKAVSDSAEYCGEFGESFDGIMNGYQIVKYVAPGTVGGQADIESGEDIAVDLPENFDPAKHVIGYAVWRIEDKDIVYEYDIPETQEFPYIADPSTDSSPVKLFDLSKYIPGPEPENTGFYGYENAPLEYPITSRLLRTLEGNTNGYYEWYNGPYHLYLHKKLEYCADLWTYNYYVNDPETIPQVYLDVFESRLNNEQDPLIFKSPMDNSLSALRIDGYSWNENVLSVECRGDYSLSRHRYEGNRGEIYYKFHVNIGEAELAVALTNKSDGKLAFLARTGEKIAPKILDGMIDEEKDYGDFVGTLHIWTESDTVEFKMPEMFDPALHDIKMYYTVFDDPGYDGEMSLYALQVGYIDPAYPISAEGYSKPEPTPDPEPEPTPDPEPEPIIGDANGDGAVNLADASHTLKHIAGWDVEIDLAAANMNGDTGVNLVDVSRILKLIAGWANI